MQQRRMVAVIGALDEEVELISQSLQDLTHTHAAGLDIALGDIASASGPTGVAAAVAGMGLVNAASAAQYMIDAFAPEAVIFSGIGGNLSPDLHINDVVLGKTLRYLDSDMALIGQAYPGLSEYHSDPRLMGIASDVLSSMGIHHREGIIASGNRFIEGADRIADVRSQTRADVAEMEGAAVCHVAARNDTPALVIRALSDNADTEYETFRDFDISEYAHTAARVVVGIIRALS
ncbi:MAG: 5'-methylthioadenosine/S-adenosylhomocysteine nucleosidase [Scardovia wiggsiae]|uniref:5'-methylthioadenosine/S-adenosylhomocysteine nucleosidase n=1 Tax=Scardovia wiggsiae TaxID=230143 RepID=UPI001CB59F86|nr:5'-methylthioadenosine/S-adenosylhomocysteine nucleosidase [Scardovia wiggsiae]